VPTDHGKPARAHAHRKKKAGTHTTLFSCALLSGALPSAPSALPSAPARTALFSLCSRALPSALPCALPSALNHASSSLVRQPPPLLTDGKRRRILLIDGKRRRILLADCSAPRSWVCSSSALVNCSDFRCSLVLCCLLD
jgi:hypothetical protein